MLSWLSRLWRRPVYYRPDGWPLCPKCGKDKLYSVERIPQRSLPSDRLACYECPWTGRVPIQTVALGKVPVMKPKQE